MTTATMSAAAQPIHHALALPDCDCGLCAPTWARRRGKSKRYTQPVTLIDALGAEDRACPPGMVAQHRHCLTLMTAAVNQLLDQPAADSRGEPQLGLTLLLFAAELAEALQAPDHQEQLTFEQIDSCRQAICEATVATAGCVTGLVGAVQALADLVG